ncbi:MAG: adenylate/guanylate cyclase domain-containing protein [Pseudomonadota bacterium]
MKIQHFFIATSCIILVFFLHFFKILERSELQSIDLRFQLRNSLFKHPVISQDIVLIGIDDHSISETDEPFILWDTFFAEVIQKVAQQHPKVIGLDIIWSKSIDQFLPRPFKQKNALRKALLITVNKYKVPVVIGVAAGVKGTKNENTTTFDSSLPMKHFGLIVGRHSFGVINTHPDSDHKIRRVKQVFFSSDGQKIPGFPYLIASKAMLGSRSATFNKQIKPPGNIHLINYQLNMEIPTYSFHEVLLKARANDTDYFKQHFKDKIVLIAINNVSDDIHATPLADEKPGIFIHAHTINNHINQDYLFQAEDNLIIFYLIIAGFITGFIALQYRLLIASSVFFIVLCVYLSIAMLMFRHNYIIPLVPVILTMLLSFISVYIYRFTVEDKNKRRLAHFFRSYVNKQVVDDILKSDAPLKLEGSREEICILFSDIRNFTTYSENHSAEDVVATLNEYFSAMTEVILAHGGTVDKFIGDGLMAFFGAPIKNIKNPTLNAIQAAFEMRQALTKLNQKWISEGQVELDNGIGLHTGEAIIGNIGSNKKMEYTAIGDAVNVASRIEGLTKSLGAPILITINSYNRVANNVKVQSKGEAPIKGHSQIEVFELLKVNGINKHA